MRPLALILTLVASTTFAQTKIFVPIPNTSEGLLVSSATPITVETVPIHRIGDTPTKPPVDGVDRVKRFQDAATAVNEPQVAKNIMALYTGMVQRSQPPNPLYTTPAQLEANIKQGTDIFLIGSTKKTEWQTFRDVLTAEWVKVAQEGGSMGDYVSILEDASTGLAKASNSEGEVFDIGAILKILEILGNTDLTFFQKIVQILPLILTLFV